MRNNLWIGSGISGIGEIPILGRPVKGLTALIRKIFTGGVQGFVYDPNDLSDVKLNWRRNLLTYSGNLSNTAWNFFNSSGAASRTGNTLVFGNSAIDRIIQSTVSLENGVTYTVSIKMSGSGEVRLVPVDGNGATGKSMKAIQLTSQPTVYTTTFTAVAGYGGIGIYNNSAAVAGVVCTVEYVQFEKGDAPTEYQPITNFNTEFLQRFPLHTLYQDAAGTIPVTATGQPVGLMLDKSKGLRYGSELISGGNFESGLIGTKTDESGSVSTWELNTANPISGTSDGLLTIATAGNFRPVLRFNRTSQTVVGKVYEVTFDYKVVSGSVSIGLATVTASMFNRNLSGNGRIKLVYVATSGGTTESFYFTGSAGAVQIDNVSSREIIGNHAYQTVSASRPILQRNATTGAYYLAFDGVDDFLKTNSIDFTATDKVSLFAGINNLLSSTATKTIAELSADSYTNQGTFAIFHGYSAVQDYAVSSHGTSIRLDIRYNKPAPDLCVMGFKSSISAPILEMRRNGSVVASSRVSQGTGKYGNHPLYIGISGGVKFPLNGHLYSLIGIGRLTTDSETAALEKVIAKNTGVTLNV